MWFRHPIAQHVSYFTQFPSLFQRHSAISKCRKNQMFNSYKDSTRRPITSSTRFCLNSSVFRNASPKWADEHWTRRWSRDVSEAVESIRFDQITKLMADKGPLKWTCVYFKSYLICNLPHFVRDSIGLCCHYAFAAAVQSQFDTFWVENREYAAHTTTGRWNANMCDRTYDGS